MGPADKTTAALSRGPMGTGIGQWLRRLAVASIPLLALACSSDESTPPVPLAVDSFLQSAETNGFERALDPIEFEFPRDHGAHPGYKHEWWYITGNVLNADQRRFGFQFTLFRLANGTVTEGRASRWVANQLFLAHAAVTDVTADRFYSDERFARGALGLAGVSGQPFRAWLEDWSVESEDRTDCAACFGARLRVSAPAFGLDLSLRNSKPRALHGDRGLSQKSATPGNASYYYSYTRLTTEGEIRVGDQRHRVSGDSWLDHEWSTSALEPDQTGWDWFSIQLSDQTELMLFQLRHASDPEKHHRSGTYIAQSGQTTELAPTEFRIESTDSWTSPDTGVDYPSGWRVLVPELKIDLTLRPVIKGQEMNHSFRYWEGAVELHGHKSGVEVIGRGYAELTGYL